MRIYDTIISASLFKKQCKELMDFKLIWEIYAYFVKFDVGGVSASLSD